MTNRSKVKGDRAELEVQALLRDHLGVHARRALGAGRKDDIGDMTGVPYTAIQVVNWKDVAAAVRCKPLEVEQQRENGRQQFAATFVRLRGGDYRVVQTPEQWFALYREAL
jgi:Holliday junction resolvase